MANIKATLLLFLLIGCVAVSSFAQSSYLGKGQNGLEVKTGYITNNDYSGFAGNVAYSFSGVLDLGMAVSRFGFNEQYSNEDLSATVLSPYISYIVIKQDQTTPLSFRIGGSYQRHIYSSEALDGSLGFTGEYFTLGTSIFTDFRASGLITIQPRVGVDYINGEFRTEHNNRTVSEDATLYNLGASLVFATSSNRFFTVTPVITLREEIATYRLSISFVLPHN